MAKLLVKVADLVLRTHDASAVVLVPGTVVDLTVPTLATRLCVRALSTIIAII